MTPKTYLSFLTSYKNVFSAKAADIGRSSGRIETGLSKLEEASVTVEKLKSELAIMESDLAQASETAEKVSNPSDPYRSLQFLISSYFNPFDPFQFHF